MRPVTPAQDPIQETPATPLPTPLPTPSPEKKTPIKRPKTGHGQFVKSKVTPEDQVTDTEATQETADSGMKLTELEDSAENLKALTVPPVVSEPQVCAQQYKDSLAPSPKTPNSNHTHRDPPNSFPETPITKPYRNPTF